MSKSSILGTENKMVEIPAEDAAKIRDEEDLEKILESTNLPEDGRRDTMDLPLAKAVLEIATGEADLLSTTNITKKERWEIIKLRLMYHYSHNPVCLIIADSHMKLNRSITVYPRNVLDGIFRMANPDNVSEEERKVGRWGRLRQTVMGE